MRAPRSDRSRFAPVLALLGALLLGACGSSGSGFRGCPETTPSPPPNTNTLRGFVVEGKGTDGIESGRPVACALVIVEAGPRRVEVGTDGRGFFDTGIAPASFAIHVVPPPSSNLAAVSVYDLLTIGTGLELWIALPVRGPVLPTPPPSPVPGLTGRLLDVQGLPQAGFAPQGDRPGGPGTLGFIWWGAYAKSGGPPWVDSGVTRDDGSFQILTSEAGRPRPFFAGNYGGRSPEADLRFFTQYAFRGLVASPNDLGDVQMVRVDREFVLEYDQAARDVLRSYGVNALSFVYVLTHPSAGEDLEVARAFSGPAVGTLPVEQRVPVPTLPFGPGSGFERYEALGYAYDIATATSGGEFSLTRSPSPDGFRAPVSYLQPPRGLVWQGRTAAWQAVQGATVYEAHLVDGRGLPVWIGVRGIGRTAASVPSAVPIGSAFLYVRATDRGDPSTWVVPSAMVRTLRVGRPRIADLHALPAQAGPPRMVRESFSRTIPVSAP